MVCRLNESSGECEVKFQCRRVVELGELDEAVDRFEVSRVDEGPRPLPTPYENALSPILTKRISPAINGPPAPGHAKDERVRNSLVGANGRSR